MNRLEIAVDEGRISAYYRRTILNMSKKVLENIAAKYQIMGGQVLEHEGKTIYNAGMKAGTKEGIAVGEEQTERRKIRYS